MNIRIILFVICFCSTLLAHCQEIIKVPKNLIPREINRSVINAEFEKYKVKALEVASILPNNFVKDGSKDYTKEIQIAVNKSSIILMPDFPILINDNGIKLKSNSVLLFGSNSKLILKSSNKANYDIIKIEGINDVKLFFPKIEGDIFRHIGNTGEWGMGITIKSSRNVKIYNGLIEGCWGDGIYIGTSFNEKTRKYGLIPENIQIYNTVCNFNSRNGISIVAGDGISIYNSIFANSRRTYPKSGIDIEPGIMKVDNILLSNNVTFRNKARGIDLMLRRHVNYDGKSINVIIDNHLDESSMVGIRVAGVKKTSKNQYKIGGSIKVSGFKSKNNNKAVKFEDIQDFNPYFNINGDVVIDNNGSVPKVISRMNSQNFN